MLTLRTKIGSCDGKNNMHQGVHIKADILGSLGPMIYNVKLLPPQSCLDRAALIAKAGM